MENATIIIRYCKAETYDDFLLEGDDHIYMLPDLRRRLASFIASPRLAPLSLRFSSA